MYPTGQVHHSPQYLYRLEWSAKPFHPGPHSYRACLFRAGRPGAGDRGRAPPGTQDPGAQEHEGVLRPGDLRPPGAGQDRQRRGAHGRVAHVRQRQPARRCPRGALVRRQRRARCRGWDPLRLARARLVEQVDSPVRWVESVQRMVADYRVERFLEVGPGSVPT